MSAVEKGLASSVGDRRQRGADPTNRFVAAGLIAGAVAGIVTFGFARAFLTPLVDESIGYEEAGSHAAEQLGGAHEHGEEVVSRVVQANLGAGVGTIVFALVMGALFAVAFTVAWARVGRVRPATDPRLVAGAVAVAGFVSVFLVPYLAYPPNPPGVGDPDTIGARSAAYLTITVVSVLGAVTAALVAVLLADRVRGATAALLGVAGHAVVCVGAAALLPSFDEVPGPLRDATGGLVLDGFPAGVLADFRVYSLLTQALLWLVLGGVFSVLLGRVQTARRDVVTA